ncbi:uncharacterized protein LOC143282128 isoform X6 [Babylonia areolata]|uniref:uncharacterized protein LOC143282128 isoform X6 n=1 Tax=Babylonia areolata TaxID=304850 RepID=UPI003FCF03BD
MTTCEFDVHVPLCVSFDYIVRHHDNHLQVFRQCSEEEGQDFPNKPSDHLGQWHKANFTLGPCHPDTSDGRVVFRGSAKREPTVAVDNIVIRPCTSLASSASPSSAEPSDTSPPPSSPPHSQDTSRKTTTPETGAGTDSRPRTPSPSPHPTSSPTPSHTSPPVTSPPVTSSPVTSTHPTSSPTPSHPSSPVTSTPVTSPTVTSPQPSSANSSRNTRNTIIIIGSSVGGAIFLILVVAAAIIIFTKVRGKGKDKALHKDRLIDNELPSPGSPPNNCTEATDFPFFKDFCRTGPDHHFFFRHHKAQYESFEMMPFHFNGHGQPWLYGRLQEDRQTSTDRSHDYQHNWTDIEMPAADYPGHDDETRRAWNGTVEEQLTPTPTEHTDRQHPSHRHTQGNHSHRPQHVHRELRGPGGRDFSEGMKDISLYRSVPHRVIALPDPEHPSVHIPRVWLNSTKPSSS